MRISKNKISGNQKLGKLTLFLVANPILLESFNQNFACFVIGNHSVISIIFNSSSLVSPVVSIIGIISLLGIPSVFIASLKLLNIINMKIVSRKKVSIFDGVSSEVNCSQTLLNFSGAH